ncbi:transcription factor of the MADS box [Mortierella alpina]|nr:transcription factor of the MADS box [Mortierella alpina]
MSIKRSQAAAYVAATLREELQAGKGGSDSHIDKKFKQVNGDDDDGDGDDDDEEDEPPKGNNKRAGRRKIKIEYIEDKSRRHITFSKRKSGIMKKAFELSTLTGTQVLLLVVSETGLVYTFTTPKLQPLVTKSEGKNLIQACLHAPDKEPTPEAYQDGEGEGSPAGGSEQDHEEHESASPPPQSSQAPPVSHQQQQQPQYQPQQHQQQHQQQQPPQQGQGQGQGQGQQASQPPYSAATMGMYPPPYNHIPFPAQSPPYGYPPMNMNYQQPPASGAPPGGPLLPPPPPQYWAPTPQQQQEQDSKGGRGEK